MSDRFTFSSAGLVHELELAMDRAGGWNAAIVKQMCEGDRLVHIRQVLLGLAEIKPIEHIVDCDLDPKIPDTWKLEEHQRGGKVKLERRDDKLFVDGAEIELYLDPAQQGGYIVGTELREKLSGKPILNACILDYLLEHLELIPASWKKYIEGGPRLIFFWGTIFRLSGGNLLVKYLCWRVGRWCWDFAWIDFGFNVQCPTAMLTMPTDRQVSPPAPDSFASSLVNPGP
jgi:hypothetical protein